MTEITAEQVFEGLFNWFKLHPWAAKINPTTADKTQEVAAQQALLLFCSNDDETFRRLPSGVQGLAMYLLLDFMARVHGPWSTRTWLIDWPGDPKSLDLARACWLAIEQEIHRTNPPPAARH
jgi:hypothetical protein